MVHSNPLFRALFEAEGAPLAAMGCQQKPDCLFKAGILNGNSCY